jgi:hypothetical protein
MGQLAQDTIGLLKDSSYFRREAGVISMDDTRVKTIEDLISRVELEFEGIDSKQFSKDDLLHDGAELKSDIDIVSMDDLSRFTARQLEDFDRTIREVEYGDVDVLKHLQVTSIPVGATQHTFFLNDLKGSYKRITGSARDLPVSTISGQEHTIKVEMGGGSLEWNRQELDAADFANVPLEMEKVRAVKRAYLEDIRTIVVEGNTNLEGLMSTDIDEAAVDDTVENPNTVAGAALKYWINKTGREIVQDLSRARTAINTGTEGRWGGPLPPTGLESNPASFTCLVPLAAFNALMDTYMLTSAGGTSQTTWDYLQSANGMNATNITRWAVVLDFDDAFTGSAAGFMLLPNDDAAYSFVKPLDLTPLPVQFLGLSMVIPYYDYFAGLKLIRNKALVRRNGIQA